VKLIKMFGLAAMAALMAMAFAGAGSAMAESTALCSGDPGTGEHEICQEKEGETIPPSGLVSHVHEATLSGKKAVLLSPATVECDVLFLGDVTSANNLGAPLVISGKFTYTNCSCGSVEETSASSTIEVLKLGHELADVTGKGVVHVNCIGINCEYTGEGLVAHALGPLLTEETNGETRIEEQLVKKVPGGFLCPKTAKLDLLTTPLEPTYVTE